MQDGSISNMLASALAQKPTKSVGNSNHSSFELDASQGGKTSEKTLAADPLPSAPAENNLHTSSAVYVQPQASVGTTGSLKRNGKCVAAPVLLIGTGDIQAVHTPGIAHSGVNVLRDIVDDSTAGRLGQGDAPKDEVDALYFGVV